MTTVSETSGEAAGKAPWHLWLIGVAAVLWNSFGCYDYLMTQTKGDAYMRQSGMTDAQIAQVHSMPVWMTGVWAIGVWGGLLAAVLLLLRRRLAYPTFVVSMAAFAVSVLFAAGTSGWEIQHKALIFDVVIAAAGVFFIAYSRAMTRAGVLR